MTGSGRGPIYRNIPEEKSQIFWRGTFCADPGLAVSWTPFRTLTSRKIDKALYLLGIEER